MIHFSLSGYFCDLLSKFLEMVLRNRNIDEELAWVDLLRSVGDAPAQWFQAVFDPCFYHKFSAIRVLFQLRCMNAVFGLKTSITLGENLVMGAATGTAVQLEALPTSEPCCISGVIRLAS